MVYNVSSISQAEGLYGIFSALNDLLGGTLGIALAFTLFTILMLTFRDTPRKNYATASFITAVIAIMLNAADLLPINYVLVTVVMSVMGLALLYLGREES